MGAGEDRAGVNFAMVFPGQGSQSVGMLGAFDEAFPVVRQTYAEASGVLGYDLWRLVQAGPETGPHPTQRPPPAPPPPASGFRPGSTRSGARRTG